MNFTVTTRIFPDQSNEPNNGDVEVQQNGSEWWHSASESSIERNSLDGHTSMDEENIPLEKTKAFLDYQQANYDPGIFVMDAHLKGNVSRFYNHSCSPNVFVQNVFVESVDVRFPWVAFFTATHIKAGTELVWDYSYEVSRMPSVSFLNVGFLLLGGYGGEPCLTLSMRCWWLSSSVTLNSYFVSSCSPFFLLFLPLYSSVRLGKKSSFLSVWNIV